MWGSAAQAHHSIYITGATRARDYLPREPEIVDATSVLIAGSAVYDDVIQTDLVACVLCIGRAGCAELSADDLCNFDVE